MTTFDNVIVLYPIQLRAVGEERTHTIYGESQLQQELICREMQYRRLLGMKYPSATDFTVEQHAPILVTVRLVLDGGLRQWETPDRFRGEVEGYPGYWAFEVSELADLMGAENDPDPDK